MSVPAVILSTSTTSGASEKRTARGFGSYGTYKNSNYTKFGNPPQKKKKKKKKKKFYLPTAPKSADVDALATGVEF
jgi:hypothetical protein